MTRTGRLSIESDNVFAILRTWLYPEQDVVLRELVSNAADAVAKRAELARLGEAGAGEGRIDVVVDVAARELRVIDDGVGMTEDEVDRYLNQIAFSGATEFAERYAESGAIIGHFGVGFYSAFMVADRVRVDTRSCRPGTTPARWEGTEAMDFALGAGDRAEVGTTVTLHLPRDHAFLASPEPVREALRTHLAFLPVPVHYTYLAADGAAETEPIGQPDPVWRRAATGGVAEADLAAFYREHFADPFDPVLAIPFASLDIGVRGVLFLRDTRGGARELEGRFDVYSRGVLVGHDVQGLVPKFLGLAGGILESDDLPLVVSRGEVRSGEQVDLVAECLTQETAIALHRLFTEDRARYEELWPEIGAFVKYGSLTDRTFASVMARRIVFEDLTGAHRTLAEFRGTPPTDTVLYTSDRQEQALAVDLMRRAGVPALVLEHVIDQPLVRALEGGNQGLTFRRVDADPVALLAGGEPVVTPAEADDVAAGLAAIVTARLPGCAVVPVALRVADLAVLLTRDEASRRTGEMAELYGLVQGQELTTGGLVERTLVVNTAAPLVAAVARCADPAVKDLALTHLVDLAQLSGEGLAAGALPEFLRRSQDLLARYLTTEEGPLP